MIIESREIYGINELSFTLYLLVRGDVSAEVGGEQFERGMAGR